MRTVASSAPEERKSRSQAKIIPFKPRANIRAATQSLANNGIATVDFGAGWYHENAMREDTPRGRALSCGCSAHNACDESRVNSFAPQCVLSKHWRGGNRPQQGVMDAAILPVSRYDINASVRVNI